MTKHLSEQAYHELVASIAAGRASINISRDVSRQFFTHISHTDVYSRTGESVVAQKLLVWTGVILAPVILISCALYIVQAFGWWAALIIPLMGSFWTILAGLVNPNGNWKSISIALLICVLLLALLPKAIALSILLFTASLWVHRLTYVAAQHMMLGLIQKSYVAYDMLCEHIDITQASA